MDKTMSIFSVRLKTARTAKNMTLKDLQQKAGVSSATVNSYSTGKTLPTVDIAVKIAAALDVSLDFLCGNDNVTPLKTYDVATIGDVARSIDRILARNGDTAFDSANSEEFIAVLSVWRDEVKDAEHDMQQVVHNALLKIDCKPLFEFFEKRETMRKICGTRQEEKEMLQAWETMQLQHLDEMHFDLPF